MTRHLIAAIGIAALLTGGACRSTAPAAVRTPQPATAPASASLLPDSLRWVRDSAEYRAAVLQTYCAATTSVVIAARSRQPGSWAVVLDAVVFVGDNILDFPNLSQAGAKKEDTALAAFGIRYFLLPNPMYGSWQ